MENEYGMEKWREDERWRGGERERSGVEKVKLTKTLIPNPYKPITL